jgi:hypothetical protein
MANLLAAYAKPAVVFDASNPQHRRWAHKFFKDRNWSKCPVRFVLFDGDDNVITMIYREVTRYYLAKEFGKIPADDWDRRIRRLIDDTPTIDYTRK